MIRFGVIGKPSDWLISSNIDKNKLQELFNIELIDIEINELIKKYSDHKENIPINLIRNEFNKEELNKAYNIYLGILDLVNKYKLDGLTIRCFDLLSSIHSTSCLALALINSSNIVASCEGDLPALLSMYIVKKVVNKSSFQANPSYIDTKNNDIVLAHCTLPLNMSISFKYDTHFESKIGVGIKGELKEEKVNIFRIGPDLDKYVCLTGKILSNLNKENLCRTQVKIHLEDDSNYFFKNPLGNHHLIIYGDNKEKLRKYLSKFNLIEIN